MRSSQVFLKSFDRDRAIRLEGQKCRGDTMNLSTRLQPQNNIFNLHFDCLSPALSVFTNSFDCFGSLTELQLLESNRFV